MPSRAMTEKTHVFPVPDFAWTIKSKGKQDKEFLTYSGTIGKYILWSVEI